MRDAIGFKDDQIPFRVNIREPLARWKNRTWPVAEEIHVRQDALEGDVRWFVKYGGALQEDCNADGSFRHN